MTEFRLKARIVSLAMTLVGLATLVGGPHLFGDRGEIIVLNLGAAILSIGVISLSYELYLHRTFTEELLDLVRLERNVAEVGLREVTEEFRFRWDAIVAECSSIEILLLNPGNWIGNGWPHALNAAQRQKTRISVFLPDPAGTSLPAIARRIGVNEPALKNASADARERMKDDFAHDNAARLLARGSKLEIRYYDFVPSFAFALTNRDVVVVVGSAIDHAAGDRSVAFRFAVEPSKLPHPWVAQQVKRMTTAIFPTWGEEAN